MSLTILKDGRGTGRTAKIDSEGRLHAFVTEEREEMHTNRLNADAYMAYLGITPTGAGDYFFWMRNDDPRDLVINWYRVWCASAEAIDVFQNPAGTPVGGISATAKSANWGSNKTAKVTVSVGVDLTGLTNTEGPWDRLRINGSGADVIDEWPGGLVIPQGGILAAGVLNGGLAIEATFSFFFTNLGDA